VGFRPRPKNGLGWGISPSPVDELPVNLFSKRPPPERANPPATPPRRQIGPGDAPGSAAGDGEAQGTPAPAGPPRQPPHQPAARAAPQARPAGEALGQVLVQMGILSPPELEAAVARQRADGRRLGEMLVGEDRITREQLAQAVAMQLGLKAFDLTAGMDPRLAGLIDERTARRLQAVPVRVDPDGRLVVAMADPANLLALDDLRILTGREIRPEVATHEDIGTLIGSTNQLDQVMADLVPDGAGQHPDAGAGSDLADAEDDAPVVRLVNSLIARAVEERASDIHFEPQAAEMTVRYRVDGVLRPATALPMRLAGGIASRIKIMADLDIAEKRVPQDGRVSLNVGGRPLDLRVATLPTVHGEKVVIRVLDKTNVLMHLTEMGFAADVLRAYESAYQRPFGAVLVTGPTGSGKSTTLYGTLNQLNSVERNIITVEDPVEYRLPGINQVQVNPRAGLTFATGLRSILRSDPDVVMIGEVRDRETAQIAIESALTGHLVLATLHTNDSAGALIRLAEMGVEPFLSASAISGVLAQRLARRLCPSCRAPESISQERLRSVAGVSTLPPGLPDPVQIQVAVGCARCQGSGYRGRLGFFEMLLMTETIQKLAIDGASGEEIARQARREGMRTLREDGLLKVLGGQTTLEELARATG
jgi:type IV pilus assembly protein PilB